MEPSSIERLQTRLSAEEWVSLLVERGEVIRHSTWEFVVRLVECHDQVGEEFYGVVAEVARRLRLEESSLISYESTVRRAITDKWAAHDLTIGHHQAVDRKALPIPVRKELLIRASKNGWSVDTLRKAVTEAVTGKPAAAEQSDEGDGPEPRWEPDGTTSFEGTLTIEKYAGAYRLIFDSEEVSLECFTDRFRVLPT